MGVPDVSVASVAPVTVRDGLAVYRIGHGEPTLVMPGPDRVERPGPPVPDALVRGVTGLGRQVVTFDPPGSGYSTRRDRPGLAEIHQCVRQTLDSCGVGTPMDAIGHGTGGLALLSYALDHPDRIGRTVLVGTGSGGRACRTAPGALWRWGHPRFWQVAALGLAHWVLRRLATERLLGNLIHRESFVDKRHVRLGPVTAADWLRPRSPGADWQARRVLGRRRHVPHPDAGSATVRCARQR